MEIQSIEIFPVKVDKAPIYLGNSTGLPQKGDYYIRPEYRSIYSRKLETLFVKITTKCGLTGWGEALAPVANRVTGEIIEQLFHPFLIGKDPRDIDVIWNQLYDSMRERGYFTGFMLDAITAVDIALWDLFGKAVNLPIYQLLGGAYRKQLPAYISGLPVKATEEKIDLALEWKAKGFQAIKLHLGYGVQSDYETMKRLREALGEDFRLMIDAHWKYSVPEAIQLGRLMEQLRVEFLEAPTLPEDIEGHVEIARALDIAVAIGEAKRTRYQFKKRLIPRAADILQPDVGRTGISEMKKIANLAETFNIPIAPHLSVGLGVCIAATLQVSAAIPNFHILEFQPSVFPTANQLLKTPLICEKGVYQIPDGAGLGIEVDEEKVKEWSTK